MIFSTLLTDLCWFISRRGISCVSKSSLLRSRMAGISNKWILLIFNSWNKIQYQQWTGQDKHTNLKGLVRWFGLGNRSYPTAPYPSWNYGFNTVIAFRHVTCYCYVTCTYDDPDIGQPPTIIMADPEIIAPCVSRRCAKLPILLQTSFLYSAIIVVRSGGPPDV